LGDASGIYSPLGWANKAIALYEILKADALICEVNNGGDLVEANLRAAGFRGSIIKVHASRGKYTRAEPISAYYDQGRVHHVGTFAGLESQMTTWEPTATDSPDRIDSLVWGLTYLMGAGDIALPEKQPEQTSKWIEPESQTTGKWRRY
jgi:phage terminase large subunit-like protein